MNTTLKESENMEEKLEMALLSNILAAYTFVADQPERTALVFLGGVCAGLLLTLCAIVFQIHCRADCHYGNNPPKKRHKCRHPRRLPGCPLHQHSDSNMHNSVVPYGTGPTGENESEEWDESCDLSARRRRRFERALLNATMFTSAEELDRAQRLEERERVLREIWMNGQPDISTVTQSLNRYY
ncbi:hypothetical protein WMY93_013565 [Mugilogobius chulae]|uniref:EVA1 domain-containing protein n=1 Tax=Mugilogobius chulae TaxID=88201 RepID=A0AAW0P3T8_9GOBI